MTRPRPAWPSSTRPWHASYGRIAIPSDSGSASDGMASGPRVVGLVSDGRYVMLGEQPRPCFYVPLAQHYRSPVTLMVPSQGDPSSLAGPLTHILRELDPDLPVFNVTSGSHAGAPVGVAPRMSGLAKTPVAVESPFARAGSSPPSTAHRRCRGRGSRPAGARTAPPGRRLFPERSADRAGCRHRVEVVARRRPLLRGRTLSALVRGLRATRRPRCSAWRSAFLRARLRAGAGAGLRCLLPHRRRRLPARGRSRLSRLGLRGRGLVHARGGLLGRG
jgi:hypothetical protein